MAGLTPSEVITAATRNSAQLLGLDQLGMVSPGKSADFLVLDANPLDDIANTRRISSVYLRGAAVDRALLRKQLKGRAWRPKAAANNRLTSSVDRDRQPRATSGWLGAAASSRPLKA